MNLQHLIQTAKQLRQPSGSAAGEFEASRDGLAEELNRRMSARPDLEKLIGPGNLAMMQDNSRNFCRFMGAMFHAYEPEALAETALWVFRAYRSHGFKTTYWPANLDTFVEIIRDHFAPATFAEIYPFFQWLIVNIPTFVKISDEQLADPVPPEPRHDPGRQP
ncbi:MAG: hypothetical protein WCH07_10280 [Deltaproteobacteria bacterium]|jgi:hypothetical protein